MPLQKTYHTRPRVKSPPLRSLVSDSVWKPDTSKGSQITRLHPWKLIQERQVTPSRERSDKVTKHVRFSFSLWPEGSLSEWPKLSLSPLVQVPSSSREFHSQVTHHQSSLWELVGFPVFCTLMKKSRTLFSVKFHHFPFCHSVIY